MPTAPGFALISLQMTHSGLSRPAYLTFGVDPTDTDPQNVCAAVVLALNTAGSLKAIMDASVTFSQVRASLGTDGAVDNVGQQTIAILGLRTMSSLPPNCAVLVHKVTARGGRRGRGRLFIPWATSNSNVDEAGIVASAEVTTINTAMGVFRTALSTNAVPMVLLHDPGITPMGSPDTVTALTTDSLISTQRRRLGR